MKKLFVFYNKPKNMMIFKDLGLYLLTAIAEIIGCYLPYLWLKEDKTILLLIPAGFSLMLFVWLLTLHPSAAGKVYAAYGGIYVFVAIFWLWFVNGVKPSTTDFLGIFIIFGGSLLIILGNKI